MCGIAGIFNTDRDQPVVFSQLKKMVSAIYHRGPDECGFLIDGPFGMGMSRLSIIDIASGSQPVHNEDQSIWVVFNGEIFNYIELRRDILEPKGHTFYTNSDTEAIVHLYEEFGLDFVQHLNGQFGIAIWDRKKKRVVLARDRVGIRPLFYARQNGTLWFASEIKSIFAESTITPRISKEGIAQVFTYWVNLPPATTFEDIEELPPGHLMICDENRFDIKQYWSQTFPDWDVGAYSVGAYSHTPQLPEMAEQLRAHIDDAIKLRLRADVPVAAYLSGGIDSSIISSQVKRHHNNKLITFSVAFKDAAYDERQYQNEMVRHIGTNHFMKEVSARDIAEHFIDVVWLAEKPMIRTAPAPLLALSKLVRDNNIKVVLTGEGADEMFGGYNIFRENKVRRFWAKNPDSKWRPLLLGRLYPYILKSEHAVNPFWQAFFKNHLTEVDSPLYSHLIRWDNTSKVKLLMNPELRQLFDDDPAYSRALKYIGSDIKKWHPLNQAQYLEAHLFMSGYLLSSQGDRMMMGNSVEGRFPFLDHRVIAFASRIPPEYKLRGLNEKFILKETFKHILPPSITNRPKQPYRAPIAETFLNHDTPELIREILTEEKLAQYGYFNPKGVGQLTRKMKAAGASTGAKDDMALAAVVSLQLLHYHFVEHFRAHRFKLAEKQTFVDLNKNT